MRREIDCAGKPLQYIGCPKTRERLEACGARFQFVDRTEEAAPGLWFVTGVHPDPAKIPKDDHLVVPDGDRFIPDPLRDDASLLLETDSDPVLVLGCAHLGVLNILDHIRETMGFTRLRAILGGTHIMFYGPEMIPEIIDKFEEFGVETVGVSHCTGLKAAVTLAHHFGERFAFASAGSSFQF
jgi:7,8-dihydropterin-6-yl-methyl-4-(beta-D-ribofuranosyl)aminobenzene 5'-phosphate synthase